MDYSTKPLYAAVDFRIGSRHFSMGERIPQDLSSADLRYLVRVGRVMAKPQDPPTPAAPLLRTVEPTPQTPASGPEIGAAGPSQEEPAGVVASDPENAPKPSIARKLTAPRPAAKKAATPSARATSPRTPGRDRA